MADKEKVSESRDFANIESERSWNDAIDRLRYASEYAQAGLKGLFLANGASIVSLLTFVGNSKNCPINTLEIRHAFYFFSGGLVFVLLTYIIGYVSQASYMQAALHYSRQASSAAHNRPKPPDRNGIHNHVGSLAENLGIGLTFGSLIAFVVGAFVALKAIT